LLGDPRLNASNIGVLLDAYDLQRRPRACHVQRTSREAGDLYELRDEVVGNDESVLRATLERRFDWLWNHDLDADVAAARQDLGWENT
jgi:salicylate hydroxylase